MTSWSCCYSCHCQKKLSHDFVFSLFVHLRCKTSLDWKASFHVVLDPKNRGDQEILDDIKIFNFKVKFRVTSQQHSTSEHHSQLLWKRPVGESTRQICSSFKFRNKGWQRNVGKWSWTLISLLTRYWTLRLCGKQLFGAIALFRAHRICTQQQEIIRAAEHLLKVWDFVKS